MKRMRQIAKYVVPMTLSAAPAFATGPSLGDFTDGLSTALTTAVPVLLLALAGVAGVTIFVPLAKWSYRSVVSFFTR